FCVDFRKLNKVAKRQVYPLPRVDDALSALSGAVYFSILDLNKGFWQMTIDDESKEFTGFTTLWYLVQHWIFIYHDSTKS
ncbi:polymerase polyprotein-like protein, partial [Leptotrombidium deliense]